MSCGTIGVAKIPAYNTLYTNACTPIPVHNYTHPCTPACKHGCTHTYLYMPTHIPVHAYTHTCACLHTYLCMPTHIPVHAYLYAHVCTHMPICSLQTCMMVRPQRPGVRGLGARGLGATIDSPGAGARTWYRGAVHRSWGCRTALASGALAIYIVMAHRVPWQFI